MASYDHPSGRNYRRRPAPIEKRVDSEWYFCFGNCEAITVFLNNNDGKAWIIPKFINAVLRGIGQVVFANNPFSGGLILTGIFWHDITVGAMVTAATSIAVLTAAIMRQNVEDISSGLISFNAVLLASVTTSLWSPFYGEPIGYKLWIFVLVGSALSVFISKGLTNILSSVKPVIPILSIPFHILVFIIFASLKPIESGVDVTADVESTTSAYDFLDFGNSNTTDPEIYSWQTFEKVILGSIFSGSQVFGMANAITALLIYAGMLIYSPILTFMCLYGSILATVVGFLVTPFPNDEIFLGVWGFNGLLSCGAIGLFYIFNCWSFLNGTASVLFTAMLQLSLTSTFVKSRMPLFGLPFILSTVLFICVNSKGRQLVRASTITYPELQRKNFHAEVHDERANEIGDDSLLNV